MKTVIPSKYDLIVGLVSLSGFGESAIASYELDGPLWLMKKGVDGGVTRVKNEGVTAKVSITLMRTSQMNAYLSGLAIADRKSGGNPFPFAFTDRNGISFLASDTVWVEEWPKPELGREATENTWILRTDSNPEILEGGNL